METVVVTGAATALGRTVAGSLADPARTLVLGVQDPDAGDELAARLAADHDVATVVVRADPRDEFDIERLMEQGARAGEAAGIDVVVPCAQVYHGSVGDTPIDSAPYSAFDDTVRANTRGVFAAIREALPHLAADARVLVPTGSVAHGAAPGFGVFAVAAAATEAVVRGFSEDRDDLAVAALEVGEAAGTGGFDETAAAGLVSWAADQPPEAVSGKRLTVEDWQRAADGA